MNESLKNIIKIIILLFIIIGGALTIYSFKNNHSNIYFLPEVYYWLYPLPYTTFVLVILVSLVLGFVLKNRFRSLMLLFLSSIFGIVLHFIFTGLYLHGDNKLLFLLIHFYNLGNALINDFFGQVPIMIVLNGFITGIILFLSNEVGRSIKDLISARTTKN